jgi:hypothetical protein
VQTNKEKYTSAIAEERKEDIYKERERRIKKIHQEEKKKIWFGGWRGKCPTWKAGSLGG